jgi:CHAT domain-containing protein/Tfp pilus assembly protein PilF
MNTPHSSYCRDFVIALLCVTLAIQAFNHDSFAQSVQQRKDFPALVFGATSPQSMARGEIHSYPVTIASGQYIRFAAEQQGIDLTIKIFLPDGRLLIQGDIANGPHGPEWLALITETEGVYRLELTAPYDYADAGRYELKIKELRPATNEDRSLIAGQSAYAEADRARLAVPSRRPEAIKKYEEAIGFFRAAGERSGEGVALTNIGVVYNLLGERLKALEYLGQAVSIHRVLGDQREEARAFNYMGGASSALLERQKALEYFNQSLRLSQSINDAAGEAASLQHIAGIYSALGDAYKAFDYQTLSLARAKAAGDRYREVRALSGIGSFYNRSGDVSKALEYFNEALTIYRDLRNTYDEALMLTGIGHAYVELKDHKRALEYYTQALPIAKTQDDRRWLEAMVLSSLGTANNSLGNNEVALQLLNEALSIHQGLLNYNWEAGTLASLGAVYDSMGQPDKALEYFNQSLKIHRAMSDYSGQASVLLRIARLERNRGNLTQARLPTEAGLDMIESLRAKFVGAESRTSFVASRRNYYEFYIDLLMRLDGQSPSAGHAGEALQVSERAHARALLETISESRVDIRQGVDPQLLDRERALQKQINDEEMQRVRVQRGKHTKENLEAIEKRINKLLEDYNTLQSEIRVRSPHYAALTQPVPLSLREIQQQVLDEKTMLLEYALGESKSYLWVVTQSELKSFELPKRSVVEGAARRVYDLLMVSNKTQARRPAELALAELGRMVLGPAADLLTKERLVIVADGALEYVPFAALASGSAQGGPYVPLLVRHEVVSLPSASVLSALRAEMSKRQPAPEALAVLADAVFQSDDSRLPNKRGNAHASLTDGAQLPIPGDLARSAAEVNVLAFPRLPFSRREADAIVARAGERRSLKALDFTASRETVFNSKLDQYRIIHFATHGLLNSRHPTLSGIVLSLYDDQGRPVDGFVRANEIYNLKLNAELVVLSGCRTALGREIRGEGLVGLTRGFMYAGTPRIVASLWDVRDEPTSELMSRFYEGMFKDQKRPSAALRAAQVSMWKEKRWAAPYYWAGFILQGEWK